MPRPHSLVIVVDGVTDLVRSISHCVRCHQTWDPRGRVRPCLLPQHTICGVGGFQVLHFNGSSPITHYTEVLNPGEQFIEFGWDSHGHLYALSNSYLHVYKTSSTSITEEAGSPYSIPEASSLIVAKP